MVPSRMTLRRLRRRRGRLTPARLLAVSFPGLILAGTLGLKLLSGLYPGDSLSWVDALFTATSPVCVTRLIVVDTASYFTPWGQAFLLLLIQLGGPGILTFTTPAIPAPGRRLGAEDADAAIVSTGGDITASALTTLLLREMGVGDVFVKVISGEHTRLMEKIGVTETIFPERESGVRLGRRISTQVVLNYVPLGPTFGLQEMAVPPDWVGKT